jgi:phage gp36-like protein
LFLAEYLGMSTHTYCTRTDVESAWTTAALLAAVDDDASGTLSSAEEAVVTLAIERAANRMNAALEMRYSLALLAGNTWCRDCNAALAIYLLATRKAAASLAVEQQYEAYVTDLEQIIAGRLRVPQALEALQHSPTVTNFTVQPTQAVATVRRVDDISTGDLPAAGVKSFHDFD